MPTIMISYRRADAKAVAGRIYDRLLSQYGKDGVFMDVDQIPLGIDYRTHIKTMLLKSDLLLAVVGSAWLGTTPDGHRRMDEPDDPVRLEIATALAEKIRIIPLLVDGAPMPAEKDLPDSLKPFSFINAAKVDSGQDFNVHMARLIASIDEILKQKTSPAAEPVPARAGAGRKVGLAVAGLGAVAAAVVAAYVWKSPASPPPTMAVPPAASSALAAPSPATKTDPGEAPRTAPPTALASATAPAGGVARGKIFQVLSSGVSDGILNMRERPGTHHPLVVSIPAGQSGVVLSGECRMPDDGGKKPWCKARWLKYEGWLSTCCIVDPATGAFPKVDLAAGTLID